MRENISVPKGGGGGMTEVKLRPTVLMSRGHFKLSVQGAVCDDMPRALLLVDLNQQYNLQHNPLL